MKADITRDTTERAITLTITDGPIIDLPHQRLQVQIINALAKKRDDSLWRITLGYQSIKKDGEPAKVGRGKLTEWSRESWMNPEVQNILRFVIARLGLKRENVEGLRDSS